MLEARHRETWTWDAYLSWEASQSLRYELVEGDVYAMTGGTAAHDTIANNLRADLRTALRGKPCRSQGPDLKVKAGTSGRYPDALIDCGPRVADAVVAQEPVAVFEVLSRSTAWVDQGLKLRDYDATASIRHYVLINQDEPRVLIYRRDESGRLAGGEVILIEGLDGVIDLPDLEVSIPLTGVYEDLMFDFGKSNTSPNP